MHLQSPTCANGDHGDHQPYPKKQPNSAVQKSPPSTQAFPNTSCNRPCSQKSQSQNHASCGFPSHSRQKPPQSLPTHHTPSIQTRTNFSKYVRMLSFVHSIGMPFTWIFRESFGPWSGIAGAEGSFVLGLGGLVFALAYFSFTDFPYISYVYGNVTERIISLLRAFSALNGFLKTTNPYVLVLDDPDSFATWTSFISPNLENASSNSFSFVSMGTSNTKSLQRRSLFEYISINSLNTSLPGVNLQIGQVRANKRFQKKVDQSWLIKLTQHVSKNILWNLNLSTFIYKENRISYTSRCSILGCSLIWNNKWPSHEIWESRLLVNFRGGGENNKKVIERRDMCCYESGDYKQTIHKSNRTFKKWNAFSWSSSLFFQSAFLRWGRSLSIWTTTWKTPWALEEEPSKRVMPAVRSWTNYFRNGTPSITMPSSKLLTRPRTRTNMSLWFLRRR